MKARAALLVLMAACTAPNSAYNPDSGTSEMGSPGPDDGGGGGGADLRGGGGGGDGAVMLSCQQIKVEVATLLGNTVSCRMDSDCTIAKTACGLEGACGTYVNTGWLTPEMQNLLNQWQADSCGDKTCPCPDIVMPAPACNKGVCGPKPVVPTPGPIGAACASDSDCESGQCLTEAQDASYAGGYCTVKACGVLRSCPTGSECRGMGGGEAICLIDCKVAATTCRTGYGCCSGPGPTRDTGWCAPSKSILCLAK